MGQRVLLVTTGIGPITAALCVRELLECRPYISEMVYMGTSGWSTQIGGVLNGDGTVNPSRKVVRIGDLCISPYAVNWECQQTDWTQQCNRYPNVDVLPQNTFGPTASFLYGQCLFTQAVKASVKLSKEIFDIAKSQLAYLQRPERSAKVLYLEKEYFGNLSAATGVKYDYENPQQATGVYDHKTCSEIDGQFFYSGVPWDMSARQFTASLLNEVWQGKRNFTQKNVIAVSAMEAVGMSFAIQQYNMFAKKKLPYTVIRGNANWLHVPVTKLKDGTWRQVPVERDFATGYGYAIASYSSVVLTWLQTRCTAQVLSGALQGPASSFCKFALDY